VNTRQRDDPRALIRYTLVSAAVTFALVWLLYEVRDTLLLIYVAGLIAVGLSPLVDTIQQQLSAYLESTNALDKSGLANAEGLLSKWRAADERISFETIKIDGPLAIAWTPYKFYYEGKFSHCGVNSFQLVRVDNQWRIQYLIDTRRRQGCE